MAIKTDRMIMIIIIIWAGEGAVGGSCYFLQGSIITEHNKK